MDHVGLNDMLLAARALIPLSPARRRAAVARMLGQAAEAAQHRRRTGTAHPRYGAGTLEGAARAWPLAPKQPLGDPVLLACLAVVCAELARVRRLSG